VKIFHQTYIVVFVERLSQLWRRLVIVGLGQKPFDRGTLLGLKNKCFKN
jgi:hypothetical protein